jgi:hypothetical protein
MTLETLVSLQEGHATEDLLQRALATPLFRDAVVWADKGKREAPLALRADLRQLAASPLLLEFLLNAVCTPAKRAWPVAKLTAKLTAHVPKLTPELRQAFAEAMRQQIEQNALPPAVGLAVIGEVPHLYLKRLPYQPPPPKPAELAAELLKELEARRGLAVGSYPPSLQELVEATRPGVAPELVKKALGTRAYKSRFIAAFKTNPDSPVALADDVDRLAASPAVLTRSLAAERLPPRHVAAVADLARHLAPALRKPFAQAVRHQAETGCLPPAVDFVWYGVDPFLFPLTETVPRTPRTDKVPVIPHAGERAAESSAEPLGAAAVPFPRAFDEAFARLYRQGGSNNFVSLLQLRRALAEVDREAFDAGLRRLRLAGGYSLRAVEGWSEVSPEERQAGIPEEGSLLLFVTRNGP